MRRVRTACAVIVWLAASFVAAAQSCDSCHDQAGKLPGTAHAAQACATCHPAREKYPHPEGGVTLSCETCHSAEADQTAIGVHGRARKQGNQAAPDCGTCHSGAHEVAQPGTTVFRRQIAQTCGMCHSDQARQFKAGVHGAAVERGVRDAPVCTDCHGEHATVKPPARTIRETCSRCHGNVEFTAKFGLPADRVVSYEASFHGLAAETGSQTVANCGSCHGVHQILPSSDPTSSIHSANLPATCGSCHPGAGRRFSLGPVHVVEGRGEAGVVRVVRSFYIGVILLVIGLMLLHNAGDWVRKAGRRTTPPPATTAEVRMFPVERVQHGLLVVSFVVLAWTGFALKYPDQFWARPLVAWESSWPVRGTVHRVAAGVFLATAALHLISLLVSARLREHWMSLAPRYSDLHEAMATFAYNLGLRRRKPALSAHSYVEKTEYWALVWGAAIMSATGVVLWANTFFLAWLPKTAMDLATVIHFYEAVLASLAIVVWHLYFVIFDPDVYPMNMAWLSGHAQRREGFDGGTGNN